MSHHKLTLLWLTVATERRTFSGDVEQLLTLINFYSVIDTLCPLKIHFCFFIHISRMSNTIFIYINESGSCQTCDEHVFLNFGTCYRFNNL